MTAEQFEDDVAAAIDVALASLSKDDVIASLEDLIADIRKGVFDPSLPATKEDKLVAALEADAPLSNEFLQDLETAIEIDGHDCEEWSARVGYAIVARLRRNELPAAKAPPAN